MDGAFGRVGLVEGELGFLGTIKGSAESKFQTPIANRGAGTELTPVPEKSRDRDTTLQRSCHIMVDTGLTIYE